MCKCGLPPFPIFSEETIIKALSGLDQYYTLIWWYPAEYQIDSMSPIIIAFPNSLPITLWDFMDYPLLRFQMLRFALLATL